jgi:predicted RNA-binding protein associated with RNAse of E/G family
MCVCIDVIVYVHMDSILDCIVYSFSGSKLLISDKYRVVNFDFKKLINKK